MDRLLASGRDEDVALLEHELGELLEVLGAGESLQIEIIFQSYFACSLFYPSSFYLSNVSFKIISSPRILKVFPVTPHESLHSYLSISLLLVIIHYYQRIFSKKRNNLEPSGSSYQRAQRPLSILSSLIIFVATNAEWPIIFSSLTL